MSICVNRHPMAMTPSARPRSATARFRAGEAGGERVIVGNDTFAAPP